MLLCGSILVFSFKLTGWSFVSLSLISPFVFLGPSHLCVPDIGRFLVACWLKSWTATTYIFLCDPYTYTCVRQHAGKSKWKHSPQRIINCGDSPLRWSGPPFLLGLDGKERKKAGLPAPGDGQFYPPVVGYHHPPASLTCRIHSSYSVYEIWLEQGKSDSLEVIGLCPSSTRATPITWVYPCWWVGLQWAFIHPTTASITWRSCLVPSPFLDYNTHHMSLRIGHSLHKTCDFKSWLNLLQNSSTYSRNQRKSSSTPRCYRYIRRWFVTNWSID